VFHQPDLRRLLALSMDYISPYVDSQIGEAAWRELSEIRPRQPFGYAEDSMPPAVETTSTP